MQKPEKQLKEYLKKIIFRFLYIHSLHKQVLLISDWQKPGRIEAIQIGSYFFELTLYSFRRTIILELCKLLSEKEDKSLLDWLKKAKQNVKALSPSVYTSGVKSDGSRKVLEPDEYIRLIEEQICVIRRYDCLLNTMKTWRDKDIAHSDRAYFNDPSKLNDLFTVSDLDIRCLLGDVGEILRKHYSLLFHGDINLDVSSSSNVDTVLKYVRAFDRVWHDKRVTRDCKIRVFKYLQDKPFN